MICGKVIVNVYEKQKIPVDKCIVVFSKRKKMYTCFTDSCGICEKILPFGIYTVMFFKSNYLEKIDRIAVFNKITFKRIRIYSYNENIILGKIIDKYCRPLNNASVILYKEDEPIDFTTSNKRGMYYFKNVSHGRYYIKAYKNGQT